MARIRTFIPQKPSLYARPLVDDLGALGSLDLAPPVSHASPRLTASEVRRRLWHMTPGFLPVLLMVIPHPDPWGHFLRALVFFGAGLTVYFMLKEFRAIARPHEAGDSKSCYAAVAAYGIVVAATLLLLPGREEIGLMTLAILAFGDGCATLTGLLVKGPALPWNRRKTWSGFLSFLIVGSLMGSLYFWDECRPGVSWLVAFKIGLLATLAADVMESLPIRGNDNLRVGLTATLVAALLHQCWIPAI